MSIRNTFFSVLLSALVCAFMFSALPAHANVYPQQSSLGIVGSQEISTEDDVSVQIRLRNAQGQLPMSEPGGKLYLWAEEKGQISPELLAIESSLEPGVWMHNTPAPGVLILDGRALYEKDRIVKVRLPKAGQYALKAIYVQEPIDPFYTTDYWPYRIGGLDAGAVLNVAPAPPYAVHYLRATAVVDGVPLPSQLAYRGGSNLYDGLEIPVRAEAQTRIDVRLSRRDGSNIGSGVPVNAEVHSTGVRLDTPIAITNAQGQASFHVQGVIASADSIRFIVDPGFSVTMPLGLHSDKPRNIYLNIGAPIMDVDGRMVPLDSPSVIQHGRTYVPYRAISEALGAEISYDHRIRTITTRFDDDVLTMTIGHSQYARNGQIFSMDATPYINSGGRTMVPVRFMAEATGYNIVPLYNDKNLVTAVRISRP